jgi:hypothetical protein
MTFGDDRSEYLWRRVNALLTEYRSQLLVLRARISQHATVDTRQARPSTLTKGRGGRFMRYPLSVFSCYLDELGTEGADGNVILKSEAWSVAPPSRP